MDLESTSGQELSLVVAREGVGRSLLGGASFIICSIFWLVRIFISLAALALLLFSGRAEEAVLSVGVAEVDITPDYPIRLSGFGGRRTESEGVTQKIWAKALAVADAQRGPAILITTDSLAFSDEIIAEVARRLGERIGLKRERLTVTSTHSHTAPMLKNVCPTLFGVPIPPEHQKNIDRYTVEFIDALEKVALEAVRNVHPSRLFWGVGSADFAANRRQKNGPVDHDLPMLAVRGLDGTLRAVYFSYACHCVTLSHNQVGGDWAGFAQKRIQELFPGSIALASVGCGADSDPNSGVTGGNVEVCARQGDQIAVEIQRLLATDLKPVRGQPELHYTRVDLALAPARSRAEWEARAKRPDAVGHHARLNLERLNRGGTLPDRINYPVQSWVFGDDLAVVFLPGETVVDYSLRLKRQYDRSRIWVNGYSNDGRCYIPSERILKEGGYEGGDAMIYYDFPQKFAPGLEKVLVDAVTAQIPSSFQAPSGTEGTRPLAPPEALRSLRTKPGLKAELVASEPLIQDPVAIDWGADGRLWVCEMNDYPTGIDQKWQPGGRIKVLEDADGDGTYDRSFVFLDPVPFPTGVTAWGKGVLICAAPDILYAEDTDSDGRADKVEKFFTNFPTDNYQARVNSLSIGLDNWIYGANGLLGGNIQSVANALLPYRPASLNIRNHDFRFDPRQGAFETVSGHSQQGRVRDDWGNWFGCNNSQLLLHFPVVEAYFARNPHVAVPALVRDLTARPDGNHLFPTSPLLERFNDFDYANRATSACGLGIYRDTLLGEDYYGNAFTCEPVHNLVHREILGDNLILTSRRAADEVNSEFLSSYDNWFRPVQVRSGPDGALYVVDLYRFLIEHPRWVPAERLAQIDVRAGADKGRIYRIVPADKPLRPVKNLTQLNGEELARALETPNGTDRDRVQVELLSRQDRAGIPVLKQLASQAASAQVRLQAVASLDALGALTPEEILQALSDADPRVRVHALRFAEPFLRNESAESARLLEAVLRLRDDSSLSVVKQLAFTLGESRSPQAGLVLADLARRWMSSIEMRPAILSSAAPHCGVLLQAVMESDPAHAARAEWIQPLVATAAHSSNDPLILQAIRACLAPSGSDPGAEQMSALATLLRTSGDPGPAKERALDRETAERVAAAVRAAGEVARDTGAPASRRVAAIALVGTDPSPQNLNRLCELAGDSDAPVRHSAIAALKSSRDPEIATWILDRWTRVPPSARPDLVSLLLDREDWTLSLLDAVGRRMVDPQELGHADRQRLFANSKPRVQELANEVLPQAPVTGRSEVLKHYRASLSETGDPVRGAAVFTQSCAVCHLLNGIGHPVGPDLVPLRSRDPEYWMKNILDPNAVVEPRFVSYVVELKDERVLGGLIRDESSTSLTVVSGSGVSETVPRSAVADIRASTQSLMPEGLEQGITVPQMADLIAFLRSGRERKQIAGNQPEPIQAGTDGVLLLPAAKAEIYGGDITLEAEFRNIGMWHGEEDHAAWTLQVEKPGRYDVFLDSACAASAAGNAFVIEVGDQRLSGKVTETGPDWSQYRQAVVGTVQLFSGRQRVVFRPSGPIQGALMDLRTVAFAPGGQTPKWPQASPPGDDVLRDPVSLARFILDASRPESARSAILTANPQYAAALIREMSRDLSPGTPDEYARIPWLWRVALDCGRRNDVSQIAAVVEASLPAGDEALRDWQAVVLGGGIINGLSQRGEWPAPRLEAVLERHPALQSRWRRALSLSAAMADDATVPFGTRYDALRLVALLGWDAAHLTLQRYLADGQNEELQMGAVSGLSDIESPQVTPVLMDALKYLKGPNRELALDGLLRSPDRRVALLESIKNGTIPRDTALDERMAKLRQP